MGLPCYLGSKEWFKAHNEIFNHMKTCQHEGNKKGLPKGFEQNMAWEKRKIWQKMFNI